MQSTQNQDETRESLEGYVEEFGDSSIVGVLLLTLASQQSKHDLQILQVLSPHKPKEVIVHVAQELENDLIKRPVENPKTQYLLLEPIPPQRDPLPKVPNYRVR